MSFWDLLDGGAGSEAEDADQQAIDSYSGLTGPSIAQQQVKLGGPQLVDDAPIERAGPSAFGGLQVDPTSRNAQLAALSKLQGITDSGGMDAIDQGRLSQIQAQQAAAERGSRDAIIQNANARGVGGSGLDLAARLSGSSDAANRASMQGAQVNADAASRRMAAINALGSLGGQIHGQDYTEAANRAQAQDAIARFNAQNQNQHAQFRQGLAQGVNNAASDAQNKGTLYNSGLYQQDYQNRAQRAQGVAQANQAKAQGKRATSSGRMAFIGSALGAAGKIAGGI